MDSSGDAYVTGYTHSTNFPTTARRLPDQLRRRHLRRLRDQGEPGGTALVYSTYLGGNYSDYGYGIALDSSGNAYVTGYTTSTNFPTTAGAYQTSLGGTERCLRGDVGLQAATHFSVSAKSKYCHSRFHRQPAVAALDVNNNTAAGYSGTVTFTSSDSQAVLPANSTLTNGTGTFTVTLKTAGSQTITATDTATTTITGTTNAVTVKAAAVSKFVVSAAPSSVTAGTAVTVTVTAEDQFNNTVTAYGGTVYVTSSDGQASLPANATLTSGTGTFSVTLKTAGTQTVTASDTATTTISGTTSAITVKAAAVNHFVVSAVSSTVTAGTAVTVTVTAEDQFNNTATAYAGTVHLTSSDAQASLPANVTLTSGTGSFSVTLKTAGNQTVTANDTATTTIAGTSNAVAVSAAAANTSWSAGPGQRHGRHGGDRHGDGRGPVQQHRHGLWRHGPLDQLRRRRQLAGQQHLDQRHRLL